MMDTRGYIDITALDPRKLVAAAFDYSRPQGMGFMHHREGTITDEEIDGGVRREGSYRYDYVRGRSMKLTLQRDRDTEKLYWHHGWYDHSDRAQAAVLVAAGMHPDEVDAAMTKAAAELVEKDAEYERDQQGMGNK